MFNTKAETLPNPEQVKYRAIQDQDSMNRLQHPSMLQSHSQATLGHLNIKELTRYCILAVITQRN